MNRNTILKGADAISAYHDRSDMRFSQISSLHESQSQISSEDNSQRESEMSESQATESWAKDLPEFSTSTPKKGPAPNSFSKVNDENNVNISQFNNSKTSLEDGYVILCSINLLHILFLNSVRLDSQHNK